MLAAFAADFLGSLAGSLIDPVIWVVALALAAPKSKYQPWLGIVGAVVIGIGLAIWLGPPLTLTFLPQACARVASVLLPVLIFQAVFRATRKPKSVES